MSPEERETIVRMEYVGTGGVSIWTTEKSMMTKCRRAGWHLEAESVSKRGGIIGQEWTAGLNDIRITVKKPGRPKIMTGYALKNGDAKK